jgi:prefoldin subunit 2
MSSDPLETELINKINELQQEAKEHQLVLDAFKSVEPERRCFRLIGGVLVERTVKDNKPSLEENLVNVCNFNPLAPS